MRGWRNHNLGLDDDDEDGKNIKENDRQLTILTSSYTDCSLSTMMNQKFHLLVSLSLSFHFLFFVLRSGKPKL